MTVLILFIFIFGGIIWLIVEFVQASSLNEFLDKKVMRRTLWLWLPVYALLHLSRKIVFNKKKE